MTKFKYPDGALWRRWDLHIHSPDSVLENNFEGGDLDDKWNKYIAKLESLNDISVLGITDYYSISGYKRLREEKLSGRLKNIDLILPNVECRFNIRTESNGTVNLHFIFNPEIVNELESRFFSNLVFEYNSRPYRCLRDELIRLGRDFKNNQELDEKASYKEGINQFKISIDLVKKILKSDKDLRENVFIAVPNSSKDGNSGVRESGFAASREEVYRVSHAIFSGNPNDRLYFLGEGADSKEEVTRKCGALKPCIHGSDAHSLNKIGVVDEDRYCWIKADPTFEGLKQITIEPDSRVKIQPENPLNDFKRSYFSNVSASIGKIFEGNNVETSDVSLDLNPYMTCIVGGRGTGKSLLLDLIRKTFDPDSNGRHKTISHADFKVLMKKTDGEENEYYLGKDNFIDYLHVSQGDVKNIVSDTTKLDKEIKIMIGMPTEEIHINDESSGNIEKIVEIKELLQQLDENGDLKYSKSKYNKLINKNSELIKAITTKENKELIEKYRANQGAVAGHQKKINQLEKEKESIYLFVEEKNSVIDDFNKFDEKIQIPKFDLSPQTEGIKELIQSFKKKSDDLINLNSTIKDELKDKGVDGDITYLLDKVKEYQTNIEHYQVEIQKIDEFTITSKNQFISLSNDAEKIKNELADYVEEIIKKWEELKDGRDSWSSEQKELNSQLIQDIEVTGAIHFNKHKFYNLLIEGLNRGKFRASKGESIENKLESIFNINTHEDYFRFISNEEMITLSDEPPISLEAFIGLNVFVKNGELDFLRTLYSSDSREKYLKVVSQIKYLNKLPEQLSVGQRGTLFLCLKLATNTFGTPFIFDQPEDDLDNNFIVNHLVPLLRKIKKYRQVILVTHNANVVVNSDSEQIVIAANIGERLFYVSGSIENSFKDEGTSDVLNCKGIKQHICDILEGGLTAFKLREKRYDL